MERREHRGGGEEVEEEEEEEKKKMATEAPRHRGSPRETILYK